MYAGNKIYLTNASKRIANFGIKLMREKSMREATNECVAISRVLRINGGYLLVRIVGLTRSGFRKSRR